jgi:uracil permease
MFVANSLIALILFANYGVNLVPAALISAGLGTIAYILITKFRSPVFLGSSAALLAVMMPCLAMGAFDSSGNLIGGNYIALAIGLGVVGLVYIIVGTIIRFTGVDWLNKLLPPVIVGSVIILIGLGLATFATSWSMYNASSGAYNGWSLFVALATMLTICIVSHYAKGFFKTIPFLCGILAGYVLALILTFIGLSNGNKHMQLIDFSIFNNIR